MYEHETIYTRLGRDGITTVMVYYDTSNHSVDVYYKRPQYPFMFAFGLSAIVSLDDAFIIADDNIKDYEEEMFN